MKKMSEAGNGMKGLLFKTMLFAMLLSVFSISHAYESISKYYKRGEDLLKYVKSDNESKWKSFVYNENEGFREMEWTTRITLNNKNEIISKTETSEAIVDKSMNLKKKEEIVKKPEYIRRCGYDRKIVEYDPDSKKISSKKFLKDKEIDSKFYEMDEKTIDIEILLLQALIKKGVGSFNADTISDAGKYNMDFELIATNDLSNMTRDYKKIPEEFKKFIEMKKSVQVYKMGLTGFASAFFPHKFYFVFDNSKDKEYIAFFGGDPKSVQFTVRTDMENVN